MQIPSQVSDDCCDRLVELFFLALPAMDGEELAKLLGYVVQIVDREIRQTKKQEARRWSEPSVQ